MSLLDSENQQTKSIIQKHGLKNSMAIMFNSKDFGSAKSFKTMDFYFLHNHKYIVFVESVSLEKSDYGYKVFDVGDDDRVHLQQIFQSLIPNYHFNKFSFYIKSDYRCLFDNDGRLIESAFPESQKWMILIKLRGFKINAKMEISPVWTLEHAFITTKN